MSSTSKKHAAFVSEPMGNKPVTAVPGIGPVLGERMKQQGYKQATQVLGKFLTSNREPAPFNSWLQNSSGATSSQSGAATNAMGEWCDNNL